MRAGHLVGYTSMHVFQLQVAARRDGHAHGSGHPARLRAAAT